MDVLVVADGHYYRNSNNEVYVESVFDYNFYSRYLSVFDRVYAIARVEYVYSVPSNYKKASGDRVYFLDIPATRGINQYVMNYFKIKKKIKEYVGRFNCAIFRIPGVVSNLACSEYMKTGNKFAVEVVVDPWEYFAPGTIKGITRPIIRYLWKKKLSEICLVANGVSYVTQNYLQKKYPCRALLEPENKHYFTSFYSSVELPDDKFGRPKFFRKKEKYIISHVANSFTGYGKGQLILMDAARIMIEKGYNLEIWFVGDGPLRNKFEQFAKKLGIAKNVRFFGRLSTSNKVREVIRGSDLFVFPTLAEGLPRVVLEAMSEGIPVISSGVCGIPEIVDEKCLLDKIDSKHCAYKLQMMLDNPQLMQEQSARNILVSQNYKSSILHSKRKAFYLKLLETIDGDK